MADRTDTAGRGIWLSPPVVVKSPEPPPMPQLEVQYVQVPQAMQGAGHPQYVGWMCCACNSCWSPVLVGCPQCNQGATNG